MKNNVSNIMMGTVMVLSLFACNKKLERLPINSTNATDVFSTPDGTKEALAKVYGAFALTGSSGNNSSDLAGINAGTSDFLRLYWCAQEFPSDEVVCAWGDPGIPDLNNMSWNSSNILLTGLYNRSLYQITVANSFLRETTNPGAAFSKEDLDNLKNYRAEARFLRAYQYWVLMDLYANPPFIDENSVIGKVAPQQIKRADLFKYVESELKAIEPDLKAPKMNEYGRADQAAEWALLARFYLNAEVYTGTPRYTDAITYSQKVIASPYTLQPKYNNLFLADNNINNPETILSINYDGNKSQNYGGTTFLVNGCINGDMTPAQYGVPSGGWGGMHSLSTLPLSFGADYANSNDSRARLLVNTGTGVDISDITKFTQGLKAVKFRNINSDGTFPANASTFVSADFPLFRLAEQHLIYAEAVLRGGTGGDIGTAVSYINKLRERAYGNTSGDVTSINLNFILDERLRELYYEAFRRTDLVRYKKFTTADYIWPWKAGAKDGRSVSDKYNIFPLPVTDVVANPNLTQNPGY
ncbi:MAG: RagB/SusD family nutrient uptake outer membrane protein [Ginsengibacter sp.]